MSAMTRGLGTAIVVGLVALVGTVGCGGTLTTPRTQDQFPDIIARPVPVMHDSVAPLDAPLGLLGTSLLLGVLAFAESLGKTVPHLAPGDTISGSQAVAIGHEVLGELFPAMRD